MFCYQYNLLLCLKKYNKIDHTFYICSKPIKKVKYTRDLGITLTNTLKWTSHATNITSKSTSLCYAILRAFNSKDVVPYIRAYKSYVRPILEFSTVLWSPCWLTDIKLLEKTQKLFTRKVLQRLNIKYKSYEDRLQILQLQSLELRRLHNDLITVYKILTNMIDLSFSYFFSPMTTTYNLRYHRLALQHPTLAKTSILRHSFKYRVVKAWNSLSSNAVQSKTLEAFKNQLISTNLNGFLTENL